MLEQLTVKIHNISYKLEHISMRDSMRVYLEDELSKLVQQREKYLGIMKEYGWTTESLENPKKKL